MISAKLKPLTVDEYIHAFPEGIQKILQQIRIKIREAAPDAEEIISYQMPAYRQNGILVYFGGFKNHVGFFPTPGGIEKFKTDLLPFKCSKGTVQFQYDEPIPFTLIKRIVKYRIEENLKGMKTSQKNKSGKKL